MTSAAGSDSGPAAGIPGLAQLYPTPETLGSFLAREMAFREDREVFGRADHWQSPEEFLSRRQGDCEDYALLAEAVLRRQGKEAFVFSLYGPGYAHTVCIFKEQGLYHIFNQDKVIRCSAGSVEEAAALLCPQWKWGAVAEKFGRRGRAVRRVHNPVAIPAGTGYIEVESPRF